MRKAPDKAQTAIEYLLLIGASVVFTIIVTLATRDVIFPTGEIIPTRAAQIASAQASFEARPSPLPSSTIIVLPSCTPGDPCGPNMCVGNQRCEQKCSALFTCDPANCISCGTNTTTNTTCPPTYTLQGGGCTSSCNYGCSGEGVCGTSCNTPDCPAICLPPAPSCQIIANPNNAVGPFGTLTSVTFANLPAGVITTKIKCNATDPGLDRPIIGNAASRNDCRYPPVAVAQSFPISAVAAGVPPCASIVFDNPVPPTCTLTLTPPDTSGVGPFSRDLKVTFQNLPASIDEAFIWCMSEPPSKQLLDASNSVSKTCNYPDVVSATDYYSGARDEGNNVECAVSITNFNKPAFCTMTATPSGYPGPFTSRIDVTFNLIDPTVSQALIKCSASDAGLMVPTTPVGGYTQTAFRNCPYPAVGVSTTYVASASVAGGNPASCTTNIIDTPLVIPDVGSLCDVNECNIVTKPFYHLKVFPNYVPPIGYTPPVIDPFNITDSCNNGGGPCKGEPCRVRGSQDPAKIENMCALIEDWEDFDWNDFQFSGRVFNYASGERLLQVKLEEASSAAGNELDVFFDFPVNKYVKLLDSSGPGSWKYDNNPQFVVWPSWPTNVHDTQSFFISDANPPSNLPPNWVTVPNPKPLTPGQSHVPPYTSLNGYVSDVLTPDGFLDVRVQVHDPSIASCAIIGGNLHYYRCTGLAWGKTMVSFIAIDQQGLWNAYDVLLTVGPTLELPDYPTVWSVVANPTQWDLWPYTVNPGGPLSDITFTITKLPPLVSCTIAGGHFLSCAKGGLIGEVTVRATNPQGAWSEDAVVVNA